MRQFSSAIQTVINSDNVSFAFLIKLEFNNDYYLTSYQHDLTYDGNTYLASAGLYEFDSPKFSSVVDRESYKVVISEVLDTLIPEFRYNVVGRPISVFVVLLDTNGDPLLGVNDVLSVYSGFVDKPVITNNFEEKLAVIEGTSPMADLDMVRSFMTSKAGMDQVSSSDTSFDEIFENKEISVKWGKV
jgi:hypothetical protein